MPRLVVIDSAAASVRAAAPAAHADAPRSGRGGILRDRHVQRGEEREYYKVLGRQNVRKNDETGKYELVYYASDTPGSKRIIELDELKTGHSHDDNEFKYPLLRFYIFAATFIALTPFLSEITSYLLSLFPIDTIPKPLDVSYILSLPNMPTYDVVVADVGVFLVLSLVFFVWFILISTSVLNNFVNVDADWTTSIERIFTQDIRVKMNGVRECMLRFRQFIKWRRFGSIFVTLYYIGFIIVMIASISAAQTFYSIDPVEATIAGLSTLATWIALAWFQRLIAEYTNWRDPTVQLSVVLAEMHQKFVESKVVQGSQSTFTGQGR